jgi:hypothetical protein
MNDASEERAYPLGPGAIVEDLRAAGRLKYGEMIECEFFEKRLTKRRHDPFFHVQVSGIRRLLEEEGLYLSGRGLKGNAYRIAEAHENANHVVGHMKHSRREAKRAVILGSTTDTSQLTDAERLRHESVTNKAAVSLALLKRTDAVAELVNKYSPKLLR